VGDRDDKALAQGKLLATIWSNRNACAVVAGLLERLAYEDLAADQLQGYNDLDGVGHLVKLVGESLEAAALSVDEL
jgi:hypothetical protein